MVDITNKKYDKLDYDLESQKLIDAIAEIKNQGGEVGLHPSYNTFQSKQTLKNEIQKIKTKVNSSITRVRQHYLKIEIPFTLKYLSDLGMKEDSTLLYGQRIGFRNGSCYKFRHFDFLNRIPLEIHQLPLIFMENHHLNSKSDNFLLDLKDVLKYVKKYQGTISLLWHNTSLDTTDKKNAFKKFISQLSKFQNQ